MKKAIFLALLVLSTTASHKRYVPVYKPRITLTQPATMAQVKAAVTKSLEERGWTIEDTKEGIIQANLKIRSHSAKVEVSYDTQEVTINYLSSTNLGYKLSKNKKYHVIHRNYYAWMKNLERDIPAYLKRIIKKSPK